VANFTLLQAAEKQAMISGRLGSNQIDKATELDNLNRFPTRADIFLCRRFQTTSGTPPTFYSV
jgi:hypothetical protein